MKIQLFDFFKRESPDSWKLIFTMAIISGIANGLILGIINAGATAASRGTVSIRWLLLFAIAMTVFITAKKISLSRSIQIAERALTNLRVRVSDKIRKSDLLVVENLSKGEIYTKLSQDAGLISQSAFIVINAAQEGIMLVFCLLYLGWLSKAAFGITVVSVVIAAYIYQQHRQDVGKDLEELTQKETELLDSIGHVITGFKEIKINRGKSDAVFESLKTIAYETEKLKVRTENKFIINLTFSSVFFYLLLAAVVFLLPRVMPTYSDVVLKATAAILFIIGPLQMVVGAAPVFARSNMALENLYSLEDRLNSALNGDPSVVGRRAAAVFRGFKRISLMDVCFSYVGADEVPSFTTGPISFDIGRGETVFLVGGNGSGKTTALKLLTGLYAPQSGVIKVDNRRVIAGNVHGYRELFSAIFGDFHLFDRLYGLEGVAEERVTELIRKMDIEEKTEYVDGRFTELNLSTGQRKRLALIAALLEDREIYVFDEWAADQDMQFRDYFYTDILGGMKESGKTVIAVTHDDRYWHIADRLIKLEYGRIVEMNGLQ